MISLENLKETGCTSKINMPTTVKAKENIFSFCFLSMFFLRKNSLGWAVIFADELLVFQREQSEYQWEQENKFDMMLHEPFDEITCTEGRQKDRDI